MTSPPEKITVECPRCGERWRDWHRPSVNLDLDDFDGAYVREATTATCPSCGLVLELGSLVIRGGVWRYRAADPDS